MAKPFITTDKIDTYYFDLFLSIYYHYKSFVTVLSPDKLCIQGYTPIMI